MQTRTLKFTYPDISELAVELWEKAAGKWDEGVELVSGKAKVLRESGRQLKWRKWKRWLPTLIIIVGVTGIVAWFGHILVRAGQVKPRVAAANTATDDRVAMQGAKATANVNREFAFPVKDQYGTKITELIWGVQSAELRDQIIVQGKMATAVQGRMFLIINLKITSKYDRMISVNTKDYFRLTVNGNDKDLLAPEIYNDPVAVQAISTKYTRVGFAVNDTDKNMVLTIGEITGVKTKIELNFQ